MKCRFKFRNIVASICLATLSGVVYADDTAMNLALPTTASFYTHNLPSDLPSDLWTLKPGVVNSPTYLLAANEAESEQAGVTSVTPATEFQPPWISGRKVHQYLGLSTVVLAGLTMATAPGGDCENCQATSQQPRQTSGTTHTRLARATAAMAVATVMAGLLFHWNDIYWEDSFTEKSTVPVSHAAMAELGAAAMVVAIKLTW
jgi:hypothetical protein